MRLSLLFSYAMVARVRRCCPAVAASARILLALPANASLMLARCGPQARLARLEREDAETTRAHADAERAAAAAAAREARARARVQQEQQQEQQQQQQQQQLRAAAEAAEQAAEQERKRRQRYVEPKDPFLGHKPIWSSLHVRACCPGLHFGTP